MGVRRRWWRGDGSPGVGGYVLAVLVSACVLGVRNQAVHVLAAGLAGAAAALVWVGTVDAGSPGWFPVQLAIATACGRAAVVPRARRRWAPRQPVGDDSRDDAARC